MPLAGCGENAGRRPGAGSEKYIVPDGKGVYARGEMLQ